MATLFSLSPSPYFSSAFLSPVKTPFQKCFQRPQKALHYTRVASKILSPESEAPPAVQTFWKWISGEGVISSKCPVKPGIKERSRGSLFLKTSKLYSSPVQRRELILTASHPNCSFDNSIVVLNLSRFNIGPPNFQIMHPPLPRYRAGRPRTGCPERH